MSDSKAWIDRNPLNYGSTTKTWKRWANSICEALRRSKARVVPILTSFDAPPGFLVSTHEPLPDRPGSGGGRAEREERLAGSTAIFLFGFSLLIELESADGEHARVCQASVTDVIQNTCEATAEGYRPPPRCATEGTVQVGDEHGHVDVTFEDGSTISGWW